MGRGAWRAAVLGVTESQTRQHMAGEPSACTTTELMLPTPARALQLPRPACPRAPNPRQEQPHEKPRTASGEQPPLAET